MSKKRPQTVNKIINQPEGDIKSLLDQLTKIKTLNNSLQQFLDPIFLPHCKVVNIRKGTLVVAVDSPVWANKLRFQLPDLISYFRSHGFISLANIDIIIRPK
jgi:hypothetical protein